MTPRKKTGPTNARPKKAPAPAAPAAEGATPGSKGYGIEPQRILDKLSQDRDGALMVHAALQACIIEDQHQAIQKLQEELTKSTPSEPSEPAV